MAKERILQLNNEIAQNIIALEYNSGIDTPEAKKQVAAATFNIKELETKLAWFVKFQKKITK